MSFIFAFFIMMFMLSIGDAVSAKTKAWVPSVFISASLFVIGFWTGWLPRNVMDIAGFGTNMWTLAMFLIIGHMGSMMSLKELGQQWKTVVIAVAGLVGLSVALFVLAKPILGWNAVVLGTPSLAGALVSTIMMGEAAKAMNLGVLALLPPAIFVVQSFVGYPLTALCLKWEGTRLLNARKAGDVKAYNCPVEDVSAPGAARKRLIPSLPEKYQTSFTHLAGLGLVGWVSFNVAAWIKAGLIAINPAWGSYAIHPLVITLIFGALAAEVGLIERKTLEKSSSLGLVMAIVMCLVMCMLKESTPHDLLMLVWPVFVIVVIGVCGLMLFSAIMGKILGRSVPLSMALTLTALYGFPPNYILTEEASKGLAKDKEEFSFLMNQMLSPMIIGGFITVTIGSVIMAGVCVTLLHPAGM